MKIINKEDAIRKLNHGKPIVFQTDTLPAIGSLPEFAETIYEVKKRDKRKALILMGSETSQIIQFVDESSREDVIYLAKKYWPGPLTLIVPTNENEKFKFMTPYKTIGIRIPNSALALSLISKVGPMATSSANISGEKNLITANSVSNQLPDIDLLGPIPWSNCSGQASTIVSWLSKGKWELVRQGELIIKKFY